MNSAYKHLETKLRIADLTIGQWGVVLFGVTLALGWGLYVSPFSAFVSLFSAVYLGGLPVTVAFVGSQSDVDAWLHVRAMARWRRDPNIYLPGPGDRCHGYAVTAAPGDRARNTQQTPDLDFSALWH